MLNICRRRMHWGCWAIFVMQRRLWQLLLQVWCVTFMSQLGQNTISCYICDIDLSQMWQKTQKFCHKILLQTCHKPPFTSPRITAAYWQSKLRYHRPASKLLRHSTSIKNELFQLSSHKHVWFNGPPLSNEKIKSGSYPINDKLPSKSRQSLTVYVWHRTYDTAANKY